MSQDTKVLEKSKLRSVSVQASQTQKYIMPKSANEKKIAVPKYKIFLFQTKPPNPAKLPWKIKQILKPVLDGSIRKNACEMNNKF